MIGLVIATHSKALAEATKEIAELMSKGLVPIIPVGGTGDEDNPFGSNAIAIADAIQQAYSPDGVLLFMDVGSSVMGAIQALELIPTHMQDHVRLCSGPVVEGAVIAAAQAACGSDLDQVFQDANNALQAKYTQLGVKP